MAKTTLKNLNIWNGSAESIDSGIDAVVIEDGRFTFVGSSEEVDKDARDMGGLTMIPGLIDAHVHLCLNPDLKDPLAQDKPAAEQLLDEMAVRAKEMLSAGITTARDLGGGQWLELEIRDRINRGELVGPRLVCSGQPITSINGHCHFWGGAAEDEATALQVLERQVAHGADLIKVMATGGNITAGSRPVDSQFDQQTLTAIVAAATQNGLRVAAHCHGTDGIGNAARAGVTTIEHCSWVGDQGWGKNYDADVMAAIIAAGVWISPTVNAGWKRYIGTGGFETLMMENYVRMRAAGAKLIASTDAGIPNVKHHHLPIAIPVFAHFAALSPAEALRAATSDCAQAIGLGEVTGKIENGFSADFLLFEQDPLTDLQVLANPAEVYKSGVPVGLSG